jgi:hypothetical protein
LNLPRQKEKRHAGARRFVPSRKPLKMEEASYVFFVYQSALTGV